MTPATVPSLLWAFLLLVPLLLASPVAYAMWRGLRMPTGAPESIRAPDGGSVLLCLGDSITHGHIGGDWVSAVRARCAPDGRLVANGGINGQQAWNLGQRLDRALVCGPDLAVLLIGSNDVMAAERPDRAESYRVQNKLPRTPDLPWSLGELAALVPRLRAAVPHVALCTVPPLGDDPDHPVAALVAQWNDAIRELAAAHDCVLLDVHAALSPMLRPARRPYEGAPSAVVRAIGRTMFAHYLGGSSWDSIAAAAGYGATIEGIHLSDAAAARVADLVLGFVRQPEGGARTDRQAQGRLPHREVQAPGGNG